ncbi:MAG TPA: hypothetical protein VD813_04955, partial [Pseudonocardia sp.]|nr:hypothetical protein [Pseudonocardia sp.]
FAPSRHLPFQLQDSTLSIRLATSDPPGSPVDASGRVTLHGTGTFTGGPPFARHRGTLTVDGALRPVP